MAETPNSDPEVMMITAQVLEGARQTQALQNAVRSQAVLLAEARRVHEGSYESILADEVERLTDRITLLNHPPMLRRLGKHALGVTYQPGYRTKWGGLEKPRISTEPIPDGEAAVLDDKLLIFSGLIAWRHAREKNSQGREDRTLHLDRQIRDETTGFALNQDLYSLLPYKGKIGPRVQVRGGEFDAYEKARCAEVLADYAQRNPWVKELGEDFVRDNPQTDGRILKLVPYNVFDFRKVSRTEPGRGSWDNDRLSNLQNELVPLMLPGKAWDFPDEMFQEPLALVQQMNLLLGTKSK